MVMMDDILCSLITNRIRMVVVCIILLFFIVMTTIEMGGCFFFVLKMLLLSHLGNHRKDINTTVGQFHHLLCIAISQQILRRDNEAVFDRWKEMKGSKILLKTFKT